MAEQIKALRVKAVGGQRAAGERPYGLMKFARENPAPNGVDSLWLAIPDHLLPYVAVQAIKLLPQPAEGMKKDIPFAIPTEAVEFGVGERGELAVSMIIAQGATISFRLDAGEAQTLMIGIQNALGAASIEVPPGVKPS